MRYIDAILGYVYVGERMLCVVYILGVCVCYIYNICDRVYVMCEYMLFMSGFYLCECVMYVLCVSSSMVI